MSLDALADQLRAFEHALGDFVDLLRTVRAEQDAAEQRVQGLWDDAFRVEFERVHRELAGPVERFTDVDAERYLEFLARKRHHVEEYLHG